jgi:hypothetical protein
MSFHRNTYSDCECEGKRLDCFHLVALQGSALAALDS